MLHLKSSQELSTELSAALTTHHANREAIANRGGDDATVLSEIVFELQRHCQTLAFLLGDTIDSFGHLALLTGHYELTGGGGVDLEE